jgi:hypothetical protein
MPLRVLHMGRLEERGQKLLGSTESRVMIIESVSLERFSLLPFPAILTSGVWCGKQTSWTVRRCFITFLSALDDWEHFAMKRLAKGTCSSKRTLVHCKVTDVLRMVFSHGTTHYTKFILVHSFRTCLFTRQISVCSDWISCRGQITRDGPPAWGWARG